MLVTVTSKIAVITVIEITEILVILTTVRFSAVILNTAMIKLTGHTFFLD